MVVSEDDILVSVTIPQLIKDEFIKKGTFQLLPNGDPVLYTGGFAMVFPVVVDNKKWAFRCWRSTLSDLQQRYKLIWEYLNKRNLPYFCKGEFVEKGIVVNGTLMPTSRMEWVEGMTLKEYIIQNKHIPSKIMSLAEKFREMCIDLHINEVSHGDLQHGNILVCETANKTPVIKLVDYDSLYVPTMGVNFIDTITGLKDYQHPSRQTTHHISSYKTDYFSELVIYLSLIAISESPSLCDKYQIADTESLLFSNEDYKNIKASKIYSDISKLSDYVKLHLNLLVGYLGEANIDSIEPFTNLDDIDNIKEGIKGNYLQAQRKNTIEAYESFLEKCPNTSFASEYRQKANNRLAELKEGELWESTTHANTLASYCYYISCSTKKTHLSEAQKRAEDLRWEVAINRDTVDAYQTYLNETDLGLHRDEAYEKIEVLSWERATRLNTEYAYRNYLSGSISKKHKWEAYQAIEDIYWRAAERAGTIESYNEYLQKSKVLFREFGLQNTKNRDRANERLKTLEAELWSKVTKENTRNSYELYIRQFPTGKYVGDCQYRIKAFKVQENEESLWNKARMSHSLTGYRNYLKNSTLKKYSKEALDKISQFDDDAWVKACNVNSEAEYQKYIDTFPDGKNVQTAQQRIRRQEHKKNFGRFFKWALAIIVISVIAIFAIKAIYTSYSPASKPTPAQMPQKSTSTSASISQIESELDAKLKGLELQKKRGKALDANELNKAKSLLNKLSGKSSKYNGFKQRIDNL